MIVIKRTMRLLSIMARQRHGCSFSQLQEECGDVPAPTLSRLLKVLIAEGAVEKDTVRGGYCLGPAMVGLARSIVGTSTADRIQPILDELARRTGQSAAYFEHEAGDLVLVAKSEMPESFHYIPVMSRTEYQPSHSFAKTMLSWIAPQNRPEFSEGNPEEDFRLIRNRGYFAGSGGNNPSIFRIIAPVFSGKNNDTPGAIGITALGNSLPQDITDEFVRHVLWAAEAAKD